MGGVLLGIARKMRSRAEVESLDRSRITREEGVVGDYRGVFRPGRANKRQVTMFMREDWETALAELAVDAHWTQRRCNLFVAGISLPRDTGARIRVGAGALFEVTGECDPCKRMEAVAVGLFRRCCPNGAAGG